MELAKDIVDKYTTEQIIAYLDKTMAGIQHNYRGSMKLNQPHILWGNLGDIDMVRAILHEIKSRNDAKEAMKQNMV